MTTIACDGTSMAGDGIITENDHICRRDYRKVWRLCDGRIVGFAGNSYNWQAFAEWLETGNGDPPKVDGGIACIVLAPDGSIFSYDEFGRSFPEVAPIAIGSGTRFALAAMDMGRTAEEAIAYACTRDIFSGGDITVVHLPRLEAVA
jgi:ATP-dependent protease HslVU (ClpYQ) peptidase subunit